MSESSICGGVFREEIAQQLLTSCASIVKSCFAELHDQCERKQDGAEVFRSCIDMVRTGWVEEDFAEEMKCAPPDFDAQFRGSFIVFVRQTYTDATGGSTVHVRVTVPQTSAFLRELLRAISLDDDLRNGAYFRTQTRLEQKDVVMQAIRGAMKALCSEFVYVPERQAEAKQPAPSDSPPEDDASGSDEEEEEESAECETPSVHGDISVNIKNAPDVTPGRSGHDGRKREGDDRSVVGSEPSAHSVSSRLSTSSRHQSVS